MDKKNRNKLLLMLAVLIMVMLSCSTVYIQNTSLLKVRVIVQMPGEGVKEITLISPDDTDSFVSTYGGTYTVSVIPDEEYRVKMLIAQDSMQQLLFADFKGTDIGKIKELVSRIDKLEKLLANTEMISCSGTVDGNTVEVYIETDPATHKLSVSCPSE